MNNSQTDVSSILASKSFRKLVRIRSAIRFSLAFLVLACHAFFVGGIAFYNQWFALPLSADSSIPRGIYFTVAIILTMIFLEFVYIWLSHWLLDPLQKRAAAEIDARV